MRGRPRAAWRGMASVLLVALVGGIGCSTNGRMDRQAALMRAQTHPTVSEVNRLLHNAKYYKLMGRPELALKELEEAYLYDPNNLKIVDTLARNYEELGEFGRAQQLYQEALARHSQNQVLANNLCYSYYLQGQWNKAEQCFRQALERDPQNMAARNNLGMLWCRQGRREEARRLWEEAGGATVAEAKMGQVLAMLGMSVPAASARQDIPVAKPGQQPGTPARETVTPRQPAAAVATASAPATAALRPEPVRPPVPPPERQKVSADKSPARAASAAQEPPGPTAATPAAYSEPKIFPKDLQAARRRKPLSCDDLVRTAIEVRNGTPTKNLAHQTRSLLALQGFNVSIIGNHWDFGAEKTKIFYRSGAESVAQALSADFFPGATLEMSEKLNKKVAVKVILGHDLLKRPQLMARLVEGKE